MKYFHEATHLKLSFNLKTSLAIVSISFSGGYANHRLKHVFFEIEKLRPGLNTTLLVMSRLIFGCDFESVSIIIKTKKAVSTL